MWALSEEHFKDPQVMPEIHFYDGMVTDGQRLKSYPDTINGKDINKTLLEDWFAEMLTPDYGRPVLLGEFGTRYRKHYTSNAIELIKDVIAINTEMGHGWALWSYKDMGEMGVLHPKEETPWMQFINSKTVTEINEAFLKIKKKNWDDVSKAGKNHQNIITVKTVLI